MQISIGAIYALNDHRQVKVTKMQYNCVFYKPIKGNEPSSFLDIKDFKKLFKKA